MIVYKYWPTMSADYTADKLFVNILVLPVQPAAAATDFSLFQGTLEQTSEEYALLQAFLQSMPIASSYNEGLNRYALSGETTLQGTVEYVYNESSGTDKAEGAVIGEFDPITGKYTGNFTYEQYFNGTFNDGNGTYRSLVLGLFGEFSGVSNPGETSVTLTFKGTKMKTDVANTVSRSDFSFNVVYSVSGALPMEERSRKKRIIICRSYWTG